MPFQRSKRILSRPHWRSGEIQPIREIISIETLTILFIGITIVLSAGWLGR